MKRVILILISAALLAALLIVPAMATTGGTAAVSGATGASGETVKLTVSLQDFPQADSISIRITVQDGLQWDKAQSAWLLSDGFGDIGLNGSNLAVWATKSNGLVSVNESVLELAFKLPEPAAGQTDFTYDVKCVVSVAADNAVIKEVEATGTVTLLNKATAVMLDKNEVVLDLHAAKTMTLAATVLPANSTQTAVQWSSDNTEIVTVENGLLTAKKTGTAKVTATVGDVSATRIVTVMCSHSLTEHPAVTPDCQKTGNNLYYTCDVCGAVLKADKTTATTVAAETLGKTGHAGGTATCTELAKCATCSQPYGKLKEHDYQSAWITDATDHWHKCKDCTAITGKAAHSYTWKLDKPATEDETGLKHEVCTCGIKRNEGTVIPKLDHVHVGITHHAAVKATCVKAGTVEYWTCSSKKCEGKYYGDKACQLVLTGITEPVNKDNHTGNTEVKDAVEATCSTAGYTGDTYCTSCKAMLKKGTAVAATGKHTAKEGYLNDDKQHWQICSHCGAVITESKKDHTYTWVIDQKPTESKTGIKHQQCTACGHKTAEGTVADKLKHSPKLVAGKAPTCTEDGLLEHFYCANCGRYYASAEGKAGDKIEKSATVLAATGHTFSQEWQSDANGHFHSCACGEVSDQAAHTTEVVNAKEATQTETGYTGDTVCTVCQYEVSKGEEIPVITTEPATEPVETAPADTQPAGDGEEITVKGIVWIVPVIIAVAVAIIIPIWKKRKV